MDQANPKNVADQDLNRVVAQAIVDPVTRRQFQAVIDAIAEYPAEFSARIPDEVLGGKGVYNGDVVINGVSIPTYLLNNFAGQETSVFVFRNTIRTFM